MNKKLILLSLFLLSYKSMQAGFVNGLRTFIRQMWNTPTPAPPVDPQQIRQYCNAITDKKITPLERHIQCLEKTCYSLSRNKEDKKRCKEYTDFFREICAYKIEQQKRKREA